MPTNKEWKEILRKEASKNPDAFYATSILKSEGFKRSQCNKCGKFFWAINSKNVCGDPNCAGGFKFIENTVAKNKLDYIQIWQEFSKMFNLFGYTPIKRYPVAARWRDDTDFVQASIYDFQPYVVTGQVEPPANPLVVPQFCLRFNDIDNVGMTASHFTGFVMIGQHTFVKPEAWKQNDYFRHIYLWLTKGLAIPKEELTFHEDGWAGGGNAGSCMEFFSQGLEIGNQVYMSYEIKNDTLHQLKTKVLDMGMGQERCAWFASGKETAYDAVFPTVTKKMRALTGLKLDKVSSQIVKDFLPYASYLNMDETEDIEKTWMDIAKKAHTDVKTLKKIILPSAAMYSVAEHSRALLVALNDGVLPSNVGGGYNLRVILRRAFDFMTKYGWKIDLNDLMTLHAHYLKPQFPELSENLNDIAEIINVEKKKYLATREKSKQIVEKLIQEEINNEKLIELYDSHGINPELIKEEFAKSNRELKIPDNFYALVAEKHEANKAKEAKEEKETLNLDNIGETKILYYDDYKLTDFKAVVLKIIEKRGKYNVILNQTAFYPVSGGQDKDEGTMNKIPVTNIFKQGNHIVHVLEQKPDFKELDEVHCKIDLDRRIQLTQHHTATHIINGAARRVLGNHVWQAGAEKTIEKARLDITHYEQLTPEQIAGIEKIANEIIARNIPVESKILPRNTAEAEYGFRLYQGGAVPGKELRVVNIPNFDVEACGGTHLKLTGEAVSIKILRTSKISDSILRIEFVAGKAAYEKGKGNEELINKIKSLLNCEENQIPGRIQELFDLWKTIVKKNKKADFVLKSDTEFEGDVIAKSCEILRTQQEHLVKTIERFISEIKKIK